jgi:predicted transcriptional regulator
MPASVTVYCRKSVCSVTGRDLQSALAPVDWHTLAECYGIEDEEIVDRALSFLQIEGENGDFTLHCRPPGLRQLEITILDRAAAQADINEIISELTGQLAIIAQHLERSIAVVTIETGYFQFVEMMPVIAEEVARWLAEIGDGCVLTDDGEWLTVDADSCFVRVASQ